MSTNSTLKDVFENLMQKPPGMSLVIAIVSLVFGLALQIPEDEFGPGTLLLLYPVAYFFYRLGGKLDNPIFTPLYGTDIDKKNLISLWKVGTPIVLWPIRKIVDMFEPTLELNNVRTSASNALGFESAVGLYLAAKGLFEDTAGWNRTVKPVLEISKAARALILPLLFAAILGFSGKGAAWIPMWPDNTAPVLLQTLANPWVDLLLLIAAIFCFLYFRVWHMVALYKLVVPEKTFHFSQNAFKVSDTNNFQEGRLFVFSNGQIIDFTGPGSNDQTKQKRRNADVKNTPALDTNIPINQ